MKPLTLPALVLSGSLACGGPSPAAGGPSASPAAPEDAAAAPARSGDQSPPADPRLEIWEGLLAEHESDGGLRYAGLARDRSRLDAYLDGVAEARPEEWSRGARLAFWINAYNALVARGVVERYPGLKSVIEVEGFFDAERHPVGGDQLTLNGLERRALDLGEPRVHFAVVCASTGCPDLRGEAYTAPKLEEQLAEQTAAFLADSTKGLRYERERRILWLSSIFDWYAGDFGGNAVAWILPRLPKALAEEIRRASPEVRFIDYDWSPNDRSRGG